MVSPTRGGWQTDRPLQRQKLGLLVSLLPHLHVALFTLNTERVWAVTYGPKRGTTYMSICIGVSLGGMPNYCPGSPKNYSISSTTSAAWLGPSQKPAPALMLCLMLPPWHQAEDLMEGVCPSRKLAPPLTLTSSIARRSTVDHRKPMCETYLAKRSSISEAQVRELKFILEYLKKAIYFALHNVILWHFLYYYLNCSNSTYKPQQTCV